ncbi:MAG: dual specificity protein phosphatase family protein [Planctomycetes bacterium]|nr:dual specificity protein phosphatase family protein [Planctomycetota bacterium]
MPYNFSFVIPGKLAGMGHPGMVSPLEGELMQLRRLGIAAIVTLNERPLEQAALRAVGFDYLFLPLADFTTPTPAQIDEFVAWVRARNDEGKAVCVHCSAGMGRTGTMLACYLVALGESAAEALDSVRRIRPGSVETLEQERCIHDFERRARARRPARKEEKR